ncbi:UDP-Glycosyltransferase superfamily protein [Actinidia rufa]|uniref:UDP-Glycosyltransferase superfamily protein n=1 Tax=Actinidia rufa TaxID=165716 RepID=A0A7J0F4R0_9ERIC|nr:UDP-Glycosyltransferase superfamily protein [Actinidia rufa]
MEVHKQHPSDDHSSFKQAQVVVVMVAFPCQSHLNQLLQLSCLISSYNIPSMTALLHRISPATRRVIVIHDALMAYVVQDIANVPNAESYSFSPISAFSSFFEGWELTGKRILAEKEPEGLPSIEGCYTFEILNFIALQGNFLKLAAGYIYNTCRSIEGTYIDLLAKEEVNTNKQIWAIGPLNQGTIKELAMGLEQSKQKVIWVLRDTDKGDIFAEDVQRNQLPEGYEEMVVRDWAPQVEILGHPSMGGFTSHCGWNSCLESITMGAPIAACPMHSDQPKNAFLVTDILKVGLVVHQWKHQEELVTSSTIAEAVKRLMASKEGEETSQRAEELGGATRQSVEEGGVSRMELDSFIAHITRATSTSSSNSPASSPLTTSQFTMPAPPPTSTRQNSDSLTKSPAQQRVIVIHDVAMAYVVEDISTLPNAESYAFNATSAFSSFFSRWQLRGKPFQLEEEPEGCYTFEILIFVARQSDFLKFRVGDTYNSCRSIEATYIDLMEKEQFHGNKQIGVIGPQNQGTVDKRINSNSEHKYVLKVGLVVNELEHREELVTSLNIAEAVKRLMASEEGEELRKRAKELGRAAKQSVKEECVSHLELGSFIAHITK